MESKIRYYLDGRQEAQEALQSHIQVRYGEIPIAFAIEQELEIDGCPVLAVLMTLPDRSMLPESEYGRRVFLSAVPIWVPSVLFWYHLPLDDAGPTPLSADREREIRHWLRMDPAWRSSWRGPRHAHDRRNGMDVPLHSSNMRSD